MKKRNDKRPSSVLYRVVFICLVLCIASSYLVTGLLAKYVTEETLNDMAYQSAWRFSVRSAAGKAVGELVDLSGLRSPGDSIEKTFYIENGFLYEDKSRDPSRVATRYTITIGQPEILPDLIYVLKKGGAEVQLVNNSYTDTFAPNDATGSNIRHTYTLTVTWPKDQNSTEFCGQTDSLPIRVAAEQID